MWTKLTAYSPTTAAALEGPRASSPGPRRCGAAPAPLTAAPPPPSPGASRLVTVPAGDARHDAAAPRRTAAVQCVVTPGYGPGSQLRRARRRRRRGRRRRRRGRQLALAASAEAEPGLAMAAASEAAALRASAEEERARVQRRVESSALRVAGDSRGTASTLIGLTARRSSSSRCSNRTSPTTPRPPPRHRRHSAPAGCRHRCGPSGGGGAPRRRRGRGRGRLGAQGVLTANLLGDDYLGDCSRRCRSPPSRRPLRRWRPVQPPVVPAAPRRCPRPRRAGCRRPRPRRRRRLSWRAPTRIGTTPTRRWRAAGARVRRAAAAGAPPALPPQNVRSGGGLGGRGYGSLLD